MMNGIEEIVARIETLPPVSPHTIQIVQMATRADYRIRDLAELIMTDMTLSAACLRAVNGARFGLRRPVDTIEQAVAYLGSREVLGIAIREGMPESMDAPLDGYRDEGGAYWAHSLRTAVASAAVARLLFPGEIPGSVYAAGLFHDMGKAVISLFLAHRPESVRERLANGSTDFLDLERSLLSIDHAGAGALLAARWQLPEFIVTAVRHHHDPGNAPEQYRKLCFAVHLGDILAMLGGYGTGCDTLSYGVDAGARALLKPQADHLPRLMLDIETEYTAARERLGALTGANNGEKDSDRR